nr:GNAT family N-acetyltransferase [uncultured Sphingomonas sp.]
MTLIDADMQDAEEIAALVNAAYRPRERGQGWTDEQGLVAGDRILPAAVIQALACDRFVLLRDFPGSPILACARVSMAEDTVHLSTLAVDPAEQGRGLGTMLIKRVEDWARESGMRSLSLSVIQQRQTLIAWYGRRGFVATGEVEPFPYDNPAVGRPLRDDLALVTLQKRL